LGFVDSTDFATFDPSSALATEKCACLETGPT